MDKRVYVQGTFLSVKYNETLISHVKWSGKPVCDNIGTSCKTKIWRICRSDFYTILILAKKKLNPVIIITIIIIIIIINNIIITSQLFT